MAARWWEDSSVQEYLRSSCQTHPGDWSPLVFKDGQQAFPLL